MYSESPYHTSVMLESEQFPGRPLRSLHALTLLLGVALHTLSAWLTSAHPRQGLDIFGVLFPVGTGLRICDWVTGREKGRNHCFPEYPEQLGVLT